MKPEIERLKQLKRERLKRKMPSIPEPFPDVVRSKDSEVEINEERGSWVLKQHLERCEEWKDMTVREGLYVIPKIARRSGGQVRQD